MVSRSNRVSFANLASLKVTPHGGFAACAHKGYNDRRARFVTVRLRCHKSGTGTVVTRDEPRRQSPRIPKPSLSVRARARRGFLLFSPRSVRRPAVFFARISRLAGQTFDGPPAPVAPEVITREAATGRATIRAVRLTEPLRVDGRLDEAIYSSVPAMSDFVQMEPSAGSAATEKTEVWILFDAGQRLRHLSLLGKSSGANGGERDETRQQQSLAG